MRMQVLKLLMTNLGPFKLTLRSDVHLILLKFVYFMHVTCAVRDKRISVPDMLTFLDIPRWVVYKQDWSNKNKQLMHRADIWSVRYITDGQETTLNTLSNQNHKEEYQELIEIQNL